MTADISISEKIICWFSCGITSAVACKLAVDKYGKDRCVLIYIEIDSAHPDNDRFISDCEKWIGVKIERRRSAKFADQFAVIEKTKYVNGAAGARCAKELKK
jgi:PP-loop superfamily ATP-utilizing enzyme